ncbi:MAG: MauE/DoxX family redox-associated membrane protein [Rubrivivax sp.]
MNAWPSIDPAASHGLAAALAALLLLGAFAKLRDLALFRAAVEGYGLVPERFAGAVAVVLPCAEAACGLLLLPLATRSAGAIAAAALVGCVTLAVLAALARGRGGIDCGCGGGSAGGGDVPLGAGLVARNAALVALALAAAAPPSSRALHAVDALSIAGTVLFLLGAWTLVNTLLAQQPRLRSPRRFP